MNDPILVLADIHGNLPALRAVLEHTRSLRPRRVLVLGDSFGELGAAQEVYRCLSSLGALCIAGNREEDMAACLRGERPQWEGADQFAPMVLSARELEKSAGDWSRWPITAQFEGIRLAHGSPERVRELLSPGSARLDALLEGCREPLMAVGHDHLQWYHAKGTRAVLAVGSVGMGHIGAAFQARYALLWRQQGRWHGRLCRCGYDGDALRAQLRREDWLHRAGPIARAGFEEAATGELILLDLLRRARQISPQQGSVLDNGVLHRAAQSYPWRARL